MRLVCSLCLTLCTLPLLMGAAVYRWVDDDGVVNYTQMKPEGVAAERISSNTGTSDSAAAPAPADPATAPAGNTQPPLDEAQEHMLADLRAAEQAREQEVARVREANCQKSREVLDRLTSRGRIRIVGDDGQERVMPEEERKQRIDEAQRGVAVNCSPTASR